MSVYVCAYIYVNVCLKALHIAPFKYPTQGMMTWLIKLSDWLSYVLWKVKNDHYTTNQDQKNVKTGKN